VGTTVVGALAVAAELTAGDSDQTVVVFVIVRWSIAVPGVVRWSVAIAIVAAGVFGWSIAVVGPFRFALLAVAKYVQTVVIPRFVVIC